MAKEIRWSIRAVEDRLEILNYWLVRNQSNTYSLKLDKLFISSVELLAEMPELGELTNFPLVRRKVVRDYMVYYRTQETFIEIITLWDSRRNPRKLKLY